MRSIGIPAVTASLGQAGHLVRDADADRVAEADLVDAQVEQPPRDATTAHAATRPVYGQPNAVET